MKNNFNKTGPTVPAIPSVERRRFLKLTGLLSASTAAFLASCVNDSAVSPVNGSGRIGASVLNDGTVDLGSGDIGISNLAYMLDQLETAFYARAVDMSSGFNAEDKKVLAELHDHEVAHREFFKTLLGPNAIPILDFDFAGIDFGNRNAVFDAAQQFESTGVAAFNGTGPLIESLDVLTIAGKMVSVEARHAALTRHMIGPKTKYALGHEMIDAQGRDWHLTPGEVVMKAQKFIRQKISISQLPTY